MDLTVSIVLTPEDGWVVAHCPELEVASQGRTDEEALANVREAIELLVEDMTPPTRSPPR